MATRSDTLQTGERPGTSRPQRPRRRAWLPAVCVGVALLFWGGIALGVLNGRGQHAAVPSVPQPAAAGRVSVQEGAQPDASVREYSVLSPRAGLMMPTVAPDGHVWVAEMDTNRLAELDPVSGTMREYALPGTDVASIMGTAADSQGSIWYTAQSHSAIGYYQPATGTFGEIPTPSPNSSPTGITIDSAGNVWFTELSRGAIGRFDVHSATMREFPLPSEGSAPYWLALDGTGAVWFTELGVGTGSTSRIGRLVPSTGQVQEWPTLTPNSGPTGIAVGPDGSVWFAESNASRLGHFTPADGRMQEYPLPAATRPYGLVVAGDGSVWLSATQGSTLTHFMPASGAFESLQVPTPDAGILWLTPGRDGDLWGVEANPDANKLFRFHL